jgi:hypothetical protein
LDLVKKITDFILETTIKEDDVWTISEALDSFMDMFSDNDWNQIVHELNVIAKSKELEKILKTKVRFSWNLAIVCRTIQFLTKTVQFTKTVQVT